ncbi:MAG: hypothetical protein IKO85_07465, partial [Bacteroidaceae bacterium]|nr:hypothetical protein [Bacteroidaceae bacterium]
FERIALGPSVPDEGSHNSYGDGGNSGLCERLRVGELARESEDKRKICTKEKLKDMKCTYELSCKLILNTYLSTSKVELSVFFRASWIKHRFQRANIQHPPEIKKFSLLIKVKCSS